MAKRKIRIVLFGLTGAGKSSLINLLSRTALCRTGSGLLSTTKKYQIEEVEFDEYILVFVDTQGLADTEDSQVIVRANLIDSVRLCQGGVDIFLLCIDRSHKFTAEARDSFEFLMEGILGPESLKNTILVATHVEDNIASNSGSARLDYLRQLKEIPFFVRMFSENGGSILFVRNEIVSNHAQVEAINEDRREMCREEIIQTLSQWSKAPYQLPILEETIKTYDIKMEKIEEEKRIALEKRDKAAYDAGVQKERDAQKEFIGNLQSQMANLHRKLQEAGRRKRGLFGTIFRVFKDII